MKMTRPIYDSRFVVLSAIPIRWSRVRACIRVWLSRVFLSSSSSYVYVSKDDRMTVTKERKL